MSRDPRHDGARAPAVRRRRRETFGASIVEAVLGGDSGAMDVHGLTTPIST